jgi:hypothetical protein
MLPLRNSTIESVIANPSDSIVIKKVFIFLIVSVLMLSTGYAQQFFIGGSLGVRSNSTESTSALDNHSYSSSSFAFSIAPMAGYYFNDAFAMGLRVNLGGSTGNSFIPNPNIMSDVLKRKTTQTQWGIDAFSRYNVWELKKFTLSFEGSLRVSGVKSKTTTESQSDISGHATLFGINVVPLLSYCLTNRWSIESQFNFMGLNFNTLVSKDSNSNKTTQNNFKLGINDSWELFNWTVGLVFKL